MAVMYDTVVHALSLQNINHLGLYESINTKLSGSEYKSPWIVQKYKHKVKWLNRPVLSRNEATSLLATLAFIYVNK